MRVWRILPDLEENQLRLVHFEVEIDFLEEFNCLSISQQLHKALTGRAGGEPTAEPGIEFRSTKKRQLVNWDTSSCRVVMESVANSDECIDKVVALLKTINDVAPVGKLSRRELFTHWILPAEGYSFKSLELQYRDTFIGSKFPWKKNTFDSSVIIDMKIGDVVLHHQSGAMKPRQLREEFAEFGLEDVPKSFLFLWAATESKAIVQYSTAEMNAFLVASFQRCRNHSRQFETTWSSIL